MSDGTLIKISHGILLVFVFLHSSQRSNASLLFYTIKGCVFHNPGQRLLHVPSVYLSSLIMAVLLSSPFQSGLAFRLQMNGAVIMALIYAYPVAKPQVNGLSLFWVNWKIRFTSIFVYVERTNVFQLHTEDKTTIIAGTLPRLTVDIALLFISVGIVLVHLPPTLFTFCSFDVLVPVVTTAKVLVISKLMDEQPFAPLIDFLCIERADCSKKHPSETSRGTARGKHGGCESKAAGLRGIAWLF